MAKLEQIFMQINSHHKNVLIVNNILKLENEQAENIRLEEIMKSCFFFRINNFDVTLTNNN
jgi:hypothetical protein